MASPTRRSTATTDTRNQAAYSVAEGSRYLKLPPATLRSWALGRSYETSAGARHFGPLFQLASRKPTLLSFWNLIEAHVLRSFRAEHGVSLKDLRNALRYAEKELGISRLLLRKELCADAGQMFLERYGELISLSASGQLAMRRIFEAHLKRVEWDEWKFPVRLYPFLSADLPDEQRPIAIDPTISFGRPVVARVGVSTAVLAERMDAGETIEDLAGDYGLSVPEVEQAVLYERTA